MAVADAMSSLDDVIVTAAVIMIVAVVSVVVLVVDVAVAVAVAVEDPDTEACCTSSVASDETVASRALMYFLSIVSRLSASIRRRSYSSADLCRFALGLLWMRLARQPNRSVDKVSAAL